MELVTAKEAADILGVTKAAIYLAVSSGKLETVRKNPHLFTRQALEDYRAKAAQRREESKFQAPAVSGSASAASKPAA